MPRPFPDSISTGQPLVSDGGPGITRPGFLGPVGGAFAAGLDLSGGPELQRVVGFRSRPVSTEAPTAGDAYVFDGEKWSPAPVAGSVVPLSRTLLVDGGTAHPPEEWDGSVARPFGTVKAAMDFIGTTDPSERDWHVLVGPYFFSFNFPEEFVYVPPGRNVVVEGASPDTTSILYTYVDTVCFFVSQLDGDPDTTVTLRNLWTALQIETFGTAQLTVSVENCVLNNLHCIAENVVLRAKESDVTFSNADVPSFGPLYLKDCDFAAPIGLSGLYIQLEDSSCSTSPLELHCGGDLMRLRNLQASVSPFFDVDPGVLEVDGLTGQDDPIEVFNGHLRVYDVPDKVASRTTVDDSGEPLPLYDAYLSAASYTVDVWATAVDTVTGDAAGWHLCAAFRLNPIYGSYFLIGSASVLHEVKDDPSWDLTFQDATAGTMYLTLKGDASNPVEWTVRWSAVSRPSNA